MQELLSGSANPYYYNIDGRGLSTGTEHEMADARPLADAHQPGTAGVAKPKPKRVRPSRAKNPGANADGAKRSRTQESGGTDEARRRRASSLRDECACRHLLPTDECVCAPSLLCSSHLRIANSLGLPPLCDPSSFRLRSLLTRSGGRPRGSFLSNSVCAPQCQI